MALTTHSLTHSLSIHNSQDYSQRLEHIGLETLQLRRIKYDLLVCYKIVSGEVSSHCNLLDLSDFTQTRGHIQTV